MVKGKGDPFCLRLRTNCSVLSNTEGNATLPQARNARLPTEYPCSRISQPKVFNAFCDVSYPSEMHSPASAKRPRKVKPSPSF